MIARGMLALAAMICIAAPAFAVDAPLWDEEIMRNAERAASEAEGDASSIVEPPARPKCDRAEETSEDRENLRALARDFDEEADDASSPDPGAVSAE